MQGGGGTNRDAIKTFFVYLENSVSFALFYIDPSARSSI